jgi:hypothetical protein
MQETGEEHRRRQLQREVASACDIREKQLALISANVANCLEAVSNFSAYIGKAETFVSQAEAPATLEKMQTEEAIRCYNLYRNYTIKSNTILFRREQRLENIRRLLRSTQFQLSTALETMDSDITIYREQVRSLTVTEEQLSQLVHSLQGEVAEQQEHWAPVAEFLEQRRKYVDPPALIAQELRRDLMSAHVNAVDELTNNEQKMLDNEKAAVRKIFNAVEAAKETYKEKIEKSHNGA